MKMQKGFTLIELMIVVAIIAILAALAISQYQDYVTKAQFSEGPSIVDGLKTAIVEFEVQNGTCPAISATPSKGFLPPTSYLGKYIRQVAETSSSPPCVITATFKGAGSVSNPLKTATVVFTGTDNGGTFSWACTSAVADKYKPAACR